MDLKTKSIFVIWLVLVTCGSWSLYLYSNQAGPVGEVPLKWPDRTSIKASDTKPTLLMFAHPRCSCSRASLNELSIILTKAQNKAEIKIMFYRPSGKDTEWFESDLWRKAKSLPNAQVYTDDEGREAHNFGAMTSGHVVLYSQTRELLFSGGITDSRAHEGDNLGRSAVIDLLLGRISMVGVTKTFGCELFHSGKHVDLAHTHHSIQNEAKNHEH